MDQLLRYIHFPSFILGFTFCVFLSFIRPSLLLIFGGLISFLRVIIIFGISSAVVIFIFKSQQQTEGDGRIESSKDSFQVKNKVGEIHDGFRRESPDEIGEYRYFPIPITKFENDPKEIPSMNVIRSREKRRDVPKANAADKYDKTLRYENFVKMASKPKKC